MKIILCGACGRMGKNVTEAAAERGATIVAGVDIVSAPLSIPSILRLPKCLFPLISSMYSGLLNTALIMRRRPWHSPPCPNCFGCSKAS